MNSELHSQFRRRLFDWLQIRMNTSRTPFRRVEENPLISIGEHLATPDLVLWINRDSLLAGALILIPQHCDPAQRKQDGYLAQSLGLRQFVTWESHNVTLWSVEGVEPQAMKSWAVPARDTVRTEDFVATFDALLQELINQAVAAVLSADALPPTYFSNLCRQIMRDVEPTLAEAARLAASCNQSDGYTQQLVRDKGWLNIWRVLALLWHDLMPTGIRPERLERAIAYGLAELPARLARALDFRRDEAALPESAAIRLHHLAGRLSQLGWRKQAQRACHSLELLLAEANRDCHVVTSPVNPAPGPQDLLINHLPPQPLAGAQLVVPVPTLAGLLLAHEATGRALSAELTEGPIAQVGPDLPERIVATLNDVHSLSPAGRRQRQAALRQSWPYRRFNFASNTPAFLWDALHLGGLVPPEGTLLLNMPGAWTTDPNAVQFWHIIGERLTLAMASPVEKGRQTLTFIGRKHPFGPIDLGNGPELASPPYAIPAAALPGYVQNPPSPPLKTKRRHPDLDKAISAKVFRDGLPDFPGQYLRRIDPPPLRRYQLPGPLSADAQFFNRVCLRGPDGSLLETAHQADAEALLLASRDGRTQIDLPIDPITTAALTAAYRDDLHRLWRELVTECRRHCQTQRKALSLAQRLWRERGLPPMNSNT